MVTNLIGYLRKSPTLILSCHIFLPFLIIIHHNAQINWGTIITGGSQVCPKLLGGPFQRFKLILLEMPKLDGDWREGGGQQKSW